MFATSIYRSSPVWMQDAFVTARAAARRAARETIGFWALERETLARERWSAEALRAFQRDRLGRLLVHATRNVPFYRREVGPLPALERGRADPFELLERFPILDKALVRERPDDFVAAGRTPRVRIPISTSGTSGTPLRLVQGLRAVRAENAFRWRQLRWAGFRRGQRQAWIRGDMVVPAGVTAPPYWRHNRAERMLMFSSYHLSPATIQTYLDRLAEFDPVVIRSYPSSILLLAQWLRNTRRRYAGSALKAVLTSSETVTEQTRSAVREAFGCEVFDWYGGAERVTAIGTCRAGRYHVLPDYGYTEWLDAGAGEPEIVGTGFNNWLMPLIRYRTGDRARLEAAPVRCACGLAFPAVAGVLGRIEDYVVLPDGRRIGRLDHILKGVRGVLEAQLVQPSPDVLVLKLVPAPDYGPANEARIRAQVRERIGDAVRFSVECVASIPRERSGKLKFVKRLF